ncbi:MAG: ligase-associated DNA damage response endonuclease PdeM [Casimicrobium sp.]
MNADRKNAAIDIEFGGETLTLLAQKAVVWAREKTLFVADVHLGKAASFRAAGVAVPSGHSKDDVARLSALVQAHDIAHLVVLGDLVHNRASYTPWLDEAMLAFATNHPALKKTLVIGNHDSAAGIPPIQWDFECIEDDLLIDPFTAVHAPVNWALDCRVQEQKIFRLAGHLHPATWLRSAREAVNLPCFWQSPTQLVLPSFGLLTGRYTVEPAAEDVTYVVTGQQIFRVPNTAR